MGQSNQQRAVIQERRRQVATLYLRRERKGRIALAMGVDPNTIASDIRWLEAQWRQELLTDPVAVKAKELAEMDDMEREAVDRGLGYFTMGKETKGEEPEPIWIRGDGHWWDRRLAIKKRRAEMLGFDAPQRKEVSGKDGGPVRMSFSELLDLVPKGDDGGPK